MLTMPQEPFVLFLCYCNIYFIAGTVHTRGINATRIIDLICFGSYFILQAWYVLEPSLQKKISGYVLVYNWCVAFKFWPYEYMVIMLQEPSILFYYLCRRRRLCYWFGLFVCLSVGLLANLWTDFDEIFWRGRAWLKDQVIQFWWRSGSRFGSGSPKSEIRILRIGGRLCSLSTSCFTCVMA